MSHLKFMVDINVGNLAKWLRIMGFDALLSNYKDDNQMIITALSEDRILLTRDTQLMKRRIITSGYLKAILIHSDDPEQQMKQLISRIKFANNIKPFSICLECNQPLGGKDKEQIRDKVPHYVLETQSQFKQCPSCYRIYWRGTHWERMKNKLEDLIND